MCLFNPKPPPAPPPMPEAPPPPPVPTTPQTPTTVKIGNRAEARMRGRTGGSALSIPLSTGGSQPSGKVNLNIGK